MQRPVLANLVLQESTIILLHILWQVGIEHKRRNRSVRQLCTIFDFDVLTLNTLRRKSLNDRKHHLIQFGGSNVNLTVLINLLSSFQNSENTLLSQGRSKDDWEVNEWSHTLADSILEGIDNLLILFLNQVPFIHNNNQTLIILLDQLENIHILSLNTTGSIKHQDTHITIFYCTDRTHDRIELQILAYLVFTTNTSSIYQIEIKAKLIVSRIDTITGRTCDFSHDITILTNKCIDNTALTGIRTTNYSKTWNIFINTFLRIILEFIQNHIQQVTCSTTCSCTNTLRITQS